MIPGLSISGEKYGPKKLMYCGFLDKPCNNGANMYNSCGLSWIAGRTGCNADKNSEFVTTEGKTGSYNPRSCESLASVFNNGVKMTKISGLRITYNQIKKMEIKLISII